MVGRLARLRELVNRMKLPPGTLALLAAAFLVGAPPAHAQAAAEYGGATGVSAGAVTSKPQLFRPGGGGPANNSLFLAKPNGPAPEQLNREWFAKQAGQKGAQLTLDATPPQTSVWIDGKFVGKAPLTLTLPAGKHHLSLLGPRQEHAERDVEIVAGKNDRLLVHLQETYPTAVAIRVFGGVRQ
jgi:hypothetical protein